MKRDELKALGIEDALIEKIMEIHGRGVNDTKAKYSDYENLKKELAELKKTSTDVNALNSKISELENLHASEKQKYQQELKETKLQYALESRLKNEGAVSVKAVKALLDGSKINLDGENLVGVDEQLQAIKETDPWAFSSMTPVVGLGGNPVQTQNDPLSAVRSAMGLK